MNMHVGSADAQRVQFKVGDRVRFVNDNRDGGERFGRVGQTATVAHAVPDYSAYISVKLDDSDVGFNPVAHPDDLEPVAAAHVPTFKTGDRVRLVRDDYCGAYKAGDMVTLTDVTDDFVWFYDREGDERIIDANLVVAADSNSTLRIQAGKFYKTRDGRKVGPMRVAAANETWTDYADRVGAFVAECLESSGTGGIYAADGVWLTSDSYQNSHDLIAEWQDEPAPAASASEPKFKVGDRAEIIDATERYIRTQFTIDTDEEYFDGEKAWSGRDHNSPYRWKESRLRLVAEATSGNSPAIVCRLENGQPLPATRPHVHASVADASKEATRLAKANPGREFAVYEMVHTVQREYEHEWQRIADTKPLGGNAHEVLAGGAGISRKVALEAVKAYRAR